MSTNTNIAPYYNDFDESNNFHQILFKPGVSVQSRELTQVQNILQTQVKRFGDSVYKDGALVSGGAQFVENVIYVKIASSTVPSSTSVIGKYAVCANGSVFRIKDVAQATSTDPYTLFLVPVTNTTGQGIRVDASEVMSIRDNYTQVASVGNMTAAATNQSGNSVYFNIDEGVFYFNGFFVKSPKTFVCLGKYTSNPTAIVGFDVVETIVTTSNSDMGGDTLFDPAQGSYNYAAPGADRYRIDLSIRAIQVDDINTPITTSTSFIEVNRVLEGQVSRRTYTNQYSLLGDTMARRTYDESGDYVVSDFGFRLERNTNDDYFDAIIQTGKAYIKGYEVETLVPQKIFVPKARSTATATGYDVPVYFGNFIVVTGLVGGTTASLPDINSMGEISFYSSTTPGAGNKIGSARAKSMEYISGTGTGAKFKIFLTDVVASGNLFGVKQITNLTYSTYTMKADIDSTGITNITGNTSFTSGVTSIVVALPSQIVVGMSVTGTGIATGTTVTSINASTIGISAATTGTSSGSVTFSATNFYDGNYDNSIFRIPHSNIASVSDLEYSVRRNISMSVSTGNGQVSLSVSGERFKDVSSNSNISRHYTAIVASKTAGALAVGTILNITTSGNPSLTLNVGSTVLTLNTGDPTFNGVVNLIATIDIQSGPRKTKTLSITPKQKTLGAGLYVDGAVYSLGYADVDSIVGVYQSVDGTPATTSSPNITNRFVLNKNHKDAFYDHSTISLVPGATVPVRPILIQFNVLEHSAGHGFFVANSYPSYNAIPSYTDNMGKVYDLHDCIDFRTKRVDDTASLLQVYSAQNISLVSQQTVDTIYNFANADYSYYLSRVDKIILQKDGRLGVLQGVPSLSSPQEPSDSADGMTLAILKIPAYTKSHKDVVTNLVKNRRYTMRDVGKLDDRISRLEYYSTLNELEKEIVNTTFTNTSNEILFNSGFIVDNFRGHGIGNVSHPDYSCQVDFKKHILRPRFEANAAMWIMNGGINGLQYVNGKKFAMLPLNSSAPEVSLVSQTVASKTVSVNPFNVQAFVGSLRLSPDRDIWYNTAYLPEIVTEEANDAATVRAGTTGTVWGEWLLSSVVMSGTIETKTFNRTGEESVVEAKTVTRSTTTDLVSTTFSYRMRDQDIEYVVDGLRPNVYYSVFIDGRNISGICSQYSTTTLAFDDRILKTNSSGSARGVIKIRNDGFFGVYTTGKKLIQISDGFYNPMVGTTYAEATFVSEGKETVQQVSRVMGVDYVTVKRGVTDHKTESKDTYVPPVVTPTTTVYVPPVVNTPTGTPVTSGDPTTPVTQTTPVTYENSTVIVKQNSLDLVAGAILVSYANGGNMNDSQVESYLNGFYAGGGQVDVYTPSGIATVTQLQPENVSGVTVTGQNITQVINHAVQNSWEIAAGNSTVNNAAIADAQAWVVNGGAATALGREPSPQEIAILLTQATFVPAGTDIVAHATTAINALGLTSQVFQGFGSGGELMMCQADPTAQTFFISGDNPDGIFVSSIDTYFSQKDPTGTIPITLELRPTVNGYPDSYKIIPGQVVIKQASDIVVPTNNVNAPLPTTWTFDTPIHLVPGEYALVLKSDSADYRVYVAEIGGKKLGTEEVISSQQTLGSYFASQNATTWTPDQNIDLMFAIRRASFQSGVNATQIFDLKRSTDSWFVEQDVLFDMFNLNAAYGNIDGKTGMKFEISTKDASTGTQSDYVEILPGNETFPGYRSKHFVTGDTKLRVTMTTVDEKVSPYVEISPSGLVMVKNIINNGDVAFPETLPSGSGSDAVYITTPYVLQEGFDATSARVYLLENVPAGAVIEVYMKGLSGNDSADIESLNWIPMIRKTPVRIPANFYEYYDSEYGVDNFSYSTFNTFRAVMFKIVMKASDPAMAPSAKKFRAISLA